MAENEKKSNAGKSADGSAKKSGKREKGGALSGELRIAASGETKVSPSGDVRLAKFYADTVVPALKKELGVENAMQVPRIEKIVLNCAIKEAVGNPKLIDSALEELMLISGQKGVVTKAKKAIAAFKVRKGNAVGVMVTLRRARMYEFLDRLMTVALPRVRDFKGVSSKAFDGRGNYSLGIREQIIFPEINYDKIDKIKGLTVTITTSAKDNVQARALLTAMGMPFRK